MNLDKIWKTTLSRIELQLDSPAAFKTWFANTILLSLNKGTAQIGCKNQFIIDWMKKNYKELIRSILEKTIGKPVEVEFKLKTSTESNISMEDPLFTIKEQIEKDQKSLEDKVFKSGLNLKYTFTNYIVGSSNRLAHAAALAIVDNPGTTYNPFYIYGGVGLGKTHVMQAIGNTMLKNNSDSSILYCSCEAFLNELVNAIRSGKTNEFRSKYRKLDLLMLDDIQFISNKVETQNELFHTFNVLHQANKQIILASDRPPTEIQNLEDRLKSRFQGGMVADIGQPDYEMRIAILQKKREEKHFNLSESIIEIIAKNIDSNIRELEGALIKVAAVAGISNGILSEREVAKILGKDATTKRKQFKPKDIISSVCENLEVNSRDIKGKRRTANIALARQIAMYLLRTELELPLTKVAYELNRSDHTTVIHAVNKVEKLIKESTEINAKIIEIKNSFK